MASPASHRLHRLRRERQRRDDGRTVIGRTHALARHEAGTAPGRRRAPHAGGRTGFTIDRPGAYLIRVESRETQSDHEHFAAVDLIVEAP